MRLFIWQGIVSNTIIMEILNLIQLWLSSTFSARESIMLNTSILNEKCCVPAA
jgi:hypothetical protein